tara:strand:- start:434 stop:1336 length:903 start_codon:yes stop_codon:yes gene_type:complete
MSTLTTAQDAPKRHELQCLEVWGGSNHAQHIASVPGLDISVHSRPLDEHGGDLYLISSCSSGWITRMLLADVSGHGASVTDLASQLRGAMHQSINTVDQSKIAKQLNTAFDAFSREGRFATALLLTYFAPTGHLVLVNAGHPPPLMKRAGESSWFPISSETEGVLTQTCREVRVGIKNLPLGVIDSTEYEQIAISMAQGDRVCLYTDAYSESAPPGGQQIGVEGMRALLDRVSEEDHELEAFCPAFERAMATDGIVIPEDDQTMIIVEHNGQERPALSIPIVSNWLKNNFGLGHHDTHPE